MAKKKKAAKKKSVESLQHEEASRKNLPTAEHQPLMDEQEQAPVRVAYERRNRDLDPQLVWRGKDEQDQADLTVNAPPLYIQEKVHPKALIDELQRESREREHDSGETTPDLFSDFNGLPQGADRTEFYKYDANWQNRMVLGDSLQVMSSLAEREGLRGQVQCIYIDPPYGIKFNSNFQWSTTTREVKDGKVEHMTREPEQVRAFRDTWKHGIHSYLGYLRDRLIVARDLLNDSGSIFVQIGDENVHRVRTLLDEVFGEDNFISEIIVVKSSGLGSNTLPRQTDYILYYAKYTDHVKYRQLFRAKELAGEGADAYQYAKSRDGTIRRLSKDEKADPSNIPEDEEPLRFGDLTKPGPGAKYELVVQGKTYTSKHRWWGMPKEGLERAAKADRIFASGTLVSYQRFLSDWKAFPLTNTWTDTGTGSGLNKLYVVQTDAKIVERCVLMATDPGDLVLDPTCGAGTTATVAEEWGRRWITIDTSRVALALARARIMGARYPYYILADSPEGRSKEAEVERKTPSSAPTHGDIRHGFVYQRVPHITLKAIANNTEIDVIWEKYQERLEPLRERLNVALATNWEEWEIPRETGEDWPAEAKQAHRDWWEQRIERQGEIDASIAAKAESEYLYDRPYEDKSKVRVAGPFTVESISPHRTLGVDEDDELIDPMEKNQREDPDGYIDFTSMVLENLRTAGVQQAHRDDRIDFTSVTPWPGELVCAEGRYVEGHGESGTEKRAAIFVGPEFGTVSRPDLVEAAREAGDGSFDVLIACAFNYEAHTTELEKLGRIPVLKARMNADLHMAGDLKNTGQGNLFVIFGEPDINLLDTDDGRLQVKVNGVDVFHPNTGEVRSDGPEGIACWFVDTDYDRESFFVRHAYFLGASDPYKSLKSTLKAEINEEAWETLYSDTSRPFEKPNTGRIAVKVINHLGDEVMKVFRVE